VAGVSLYTALARPLLFALDAERAHDLVMGVLSLPGASGTLVRDRATPPDERLHQDVFGLRFLSPVGLAAGLDKHGQALGAWAALGFGAAEVGTVTPRPQPGNPRPRLFRLPPDEALINRYGFNSVGAAKVAANLQRGRPHDMRLGINLGKNKETPNERAVDDYVMALDALAELADYVVVNVSSPNTSGLRDLQQRAALRGLVEAVVARARERAPGRDLPVLVKLSPDLSEAELLEATDAALEGGARGIIATNTTLARDWLRSPEQLTRETGGLSGAPLRSRALAVCRTLFRHVRGRVPIVGVGGIGSAETAYERIRAGASLIQIYSALVYRGPGLADEITQGLAALLARDGFTHLREAIGIDAQ
jgi:dihydroorotate dehydrogenase